MIGVANWVEGFILAISLVANHDGAHQASLAISPNSPPKHELYVMAKVDQSQHYGAQYRYQIHPNVQLRAGVVDVQDTELMLGTRIVGPLLAVELGINFNQTGLKSGSGMLGVRW